MTSILTNNGAIVALQNLKATNASLAKAQSEIATGKKIADAKDNAAIWAIGKVMDSDVSGFKAISDSLSLGKSTVAVARAAAETTQAQLVEMKKLIVAAQGDNVDRKKLNDDMTKLRDQISGAVDAAQFNGLNLVNGMSDETIKILSSLDRSANGGVTANNIDVEAQNLKVGVEVTTFNTALSKAVADGGTITLIALDFQDDAGAAGGTAAVAPKGTMQDLKAANSLLAGDVISLRLGDRQVTYTIKEGDDSAAVATGMNEAIVAAGFVQADGTTQTVTWDADADVTNSTGKALDMGVTVSRGGMGQLNSLDITTKEGADAARVAIESLIQRSVDAGAAFGSAERRVEIQTNFIGKLVDAMNAGIGSMVDADMEEASARLTALQTQQQLGIQALSIANQAPQSILALFRG